MLTDEQIGSVTSELRLALEATGLNHADQLKVLRDLQDQLIAGKALCAICHTLVPLERFKVGPGADHRAACGRWCMPPLGDRSLIEEPIHEDIETCEGCKERDLQFATRPFIKL